jgi:hypothetical protein
MKVFKGILYTLSFLTIFAVIRNLVLSFDLYYFINHPPSSFSLGVFQSDPKYGHLPKPDNSGFYYFNDGSRKMMPINEIGTRTIKNNKLSKENIEYVFIGDSYTFGDGIDAESGFPFLVQNYYNKRIENLGVSSYNYAHFLLKLKEISEWEIQPKKIIVQLSPWLIERSTKRSLTSFLKLQVPFLYLNKNDKIKISLPLYESKVYLFFEDKEIMEQYVKNNFSNFISFYLDIGSRLYFNIMINELSIINESITYNKIKRLEKVEEYLITESTKLFSDSTLLFLNIGYQTTPKYLNHNYKYINTKKLMADLLLKEEDFDKTYRISSNKNNEIIDNHYNELANSIIAKLIISELESFTEK